ncbi:MAG: N-acetylmuramoyl-L-alanine amidase [Oscillospiraceae bacterium]|nr:N-acetylmuramoyl-L-alanine amidase [Oscillospiraceae bacterium]
MIRKTFQQMICILLSCILVFSMLAGCAGQTVQDTTVPETSEPPASDPPKPEPPIPLTVMLPAENQFMTMDKVVNFQGLSDLRFPLTINGTEIPRESDGGFTYEAPLEIGNNEITVVHQDQTLTYRIEYRYATEFFSQAQDTTYHSGARMYMGVSARAGSTVTATFREEKKTLHLTVDQLGSGAKEGFHLYTGFFDMPSNNTEQQDLGNITYTITCEDTTETYTSGKISCAAKVPVKTSDPNSTPKGEGYINVGSGYIVEVIDGNVETFNGKTSDDKSNPTYNYLPKGTVDYASQNVVYDSTGEKEYMLLRCGVRVYRKTKNTPNPTQSMVVDCYTGLLPDHNEIVFNPITVEGHHTYLTLDTLWKAPFFLNHEPQDYKNASHRDYRVDNFDAGYIDIRFCYATKVTGSVTIPLENPLFTKAELTQNEADCTLRLYLKEAGGFYGWDAYYNDQGQLCFRFLNPVKVTKADNAYGADLTGVRIMLDVGHGGGDIGALGRDSNGVGWTESERNLILSNYVRKELESIGATVIMNRTTMEDTTTQRERIQFLREQAPDYCLCIHHNSNSNKSLYGYETGYFTIFTQPAADHIHEAVAASKLYRSAYVMWFYYYVSRQTTCPIVLTENGYMSSVTELEQMLKDSVMQEKAKALTQGVVNYFLEMNGLTQ